jgi:DNA-directed RNA polymerase subunit L
MKLKIVKEEDDYVEIAVEGEEHSLLNALRDILLEDKKVEFAAYYIDHPQVGIPRIMIRTKEGSPIAALREAVKKLRKRADEFREEIKDAKPLKKK